MAAALQPGISEKDSIRLQGSSPDFDSNRILEEITRSAQHATNASGAALVLSDGKIMSCRACSGGLGPPVGTRLNTDTGFTATCVQTKEVVRCDDTETDARVDGSSCIELGIRSILAVPVFNAQNVAGVLEVLSNEPNKFTNRHATALRLMARLVETIADYASRDDVSLDTMTPGAKPASNDSGKPNIDQPKLTCLSCKHPNPQGSQFCNQCGAILYSFLGSQDVTPDRSLQQDTEGNADQGFREICDILPGGPATWSEFSETLLRDQRSVAAQDKPSTATTEEKAKRTEEADKTEDTAQGVGTTQGGSGIKARLGSALRRSRWL
jgi:GAF domain